MIRRLAAELVLLLHFAFVMLAVFGALGVLIVPGWVWVHLPIVIWSSVVNRPNPKRSEECARSSPSPSAFNT